MTHRALLSVVTVSLALFSSGCCCVDSCSNSGLDYGGAGCNQLCSAQVAMGGGNAGCASGSCAGGGCNARANPCVDGPRNGNPCSDGCCGDGWGSGFCGIGGRSGCGWGCGPEVFVDGNGKPCYGPIMGLATLMRDSFMSCGCGDLYVDEWVSDPPLCNDPCPNTGDGCGGGDCGGCGGGGCGNGCQTCQHRPGGARRAGYAQRNYDLSSRNRKRCSCGTCGQGYHGNADRPVTARSSAQRVAEVQRRRHRATIKNKLVQFAGNSPVKQWGDAASQRLRDVEIQPRLQPISLRSNKTPKTSSKVRTVGWFN